jgi:hypothetical protein
MKRYSLARSISVSLRKPWTHFHGHTLLGLCAEANGIFFQHAGNASWIIGEHQGLNASGTIQEDRGTGCWQEVGTRNLWSSACSDSDVDRVGRVGQQRILTRRVSGGLRCFIIQEQWRRERPRHRRSATCDTGSL